METEVFIKKLTCVSYNCGGGVDKLKLPFIKTIFQESDFLFLQEHCLFKSQLGVFDDIDEGVGKHGVSAMDENVLSRGRPHGGVAIVWNKNIACKVTPVLCCVVVQCSLL